MPRTRGIPKLDNDRVQDVGDAVLPWEEDRKRKGLLPKQTLQHDVFVGVFSLDEAYAQLHEALGYPEEGENGDPQRAGESALAVFTVADDGRVILGSQVLSSCAWAIGRALVDGAGSRGWLEGFERAAGEFRVGFEELIATPDEEDTGEGGVYDEGGAGPVLHRTTLERDPCRRTRRRRVAAIGETQDKVNSAPRRGRGRGRGSESTSSRRCPSVN